MSPNTYGDCLTTYKERLGLGKEAVGDLTSLVSVTMSPWPSDPDILKAMADGVKKIAKQEIEVHIIQAHVLKKKTLTLCSDAVNATLQRPITMDSSCKET